MRKETIHNNNAMKGLQVEDLAHHVVEDLDRLVIVGIVLDRLNVDKALDRLDGDIDLVLVPLVVIAVTAQLKDRLVMR